MTKNMLKTNVFFLIDSSGSMKSIKDETLKHFNEQIKQIKSASRPNMETLISLYTFDENIKEVLFQKPIAEVQELSSKDYRPVGMTSVVDAISSVLDKVEALSDSDSAFLFCILSDGSENSSNTPIANVAKRIGKLQDTNNWTFTFTGANQDVDKIASKLKIPHGNALKYESHSLGVNTMTETQSKSLGYFFTARSYGTTSTRGFYGSLR